MTSRKRQPGMVFVPFERQPDGTLRKRDDLPRFLTAGEVKMYIAQNSRRLSRWLLEWEEREEKEYMEEYLAGVGTPQFRRQ